MSKVLNTSVIITIQNSYGVEIKSQPFPITQHNYRRFVNNFRDNNENQQATIVYVDGSKTLLKEISKDAYLKNKVVVI